MALGLSVLCVPGAPLALAAIGLLGLCRQQATECPRCPACTCGAAPPCPACSVPPPGLSASERGLLHLGLLGLGWLARSAAQHLWCGCRNRLRVDTAAGPTEPAAQRALGASPRPERTRAALVGPELALTDALEIIRTPPSAGGSSPGEEAVWRPRSRR